jgi:protein-S-isoprenylcysteine O-methyltransferase Ste14
MKRLVNFMDDCIYGNDDAFYKITRAGRSAALVPLGVFALVALALGPDSTVAQGAGVVGVVLWAAFVLFWWSRIPKVREREKRDQQAQD